MTSKEYLEFLQVATGLAEGHAVQTLEEPTLDTYKAILDREHRSNEYMLSTPEEELAAIETRIQNVRPYCSKYESLNDMLIMSDLKSGIDGALERLELAPFEDITIGTLPSGEMNALTIQVPGGQGHLIAFNRGVFTFIELAANILTQSIAIKKTNPEFATLESASRNVKFRLEYGWRDFAKTLLSAPNPLLRFSELLESYVLNNDARLARSWVVPPIMRQYSIMMAHVMELFMLAHEAAHVVLKHSPGTKTFAADLKEQRVETYWRDWIEEANADVLAYRITTEALEAEGRLPLFAYMGIQHLLCIMEMVDRARNILSQGIDQETDTGSHPPASSRRVVLQTLAADTEEGRQLVEAATGAIQNRAYSLWGGARTKFFKIRKSRMAAQQPNRHVRLDKSLHFTSHEILFGVLKQAAAEMPVQPSFQPSRVPDTSERKEGSLTRKTLIKHLKLLISARAQHWFWSRIGRHVTGPLLRPTEVAKYWRLRVLDAMTYSWMVVAVALIAIGVLATSLSGIHNIGAAAAVSLLLAVCPLCILGYYGLNADGSFPHSLEVLTVVMILAAVVSERMGLPTITLVMTGCLTGFVFCPLHIKWKRGVLIGSVKRGLLALCSLAFATGAAVSTRAGQLNVTALREYVLVGVLIAFIIVGLHCKTPRMRYFGLTVVLACGTGALLATAAASLSQIRGSEAMLFGMSLFLSVGASMLARIIWAFAAGRGFKRSLNQVVESVPFWSAVTQTVAVIAAWIALACVVRVEHRPFAIVALVIVAALLLLLCLLDVPRYLISSCVAWLLRADDAIAARKWLSSGDKVEYLARRIRTTDSLRFTLAPIVDWIVCASAIDVDRGLQLLDEYSQSSCEIRSIARVLEMLLKTSQNTCRVFTWAIACGWTKELVTVGNKNEIARDMARLLFALGVLPTAPYSKNRALTIRSKGVVHEIARLDVNDQTHLAWEVDRSLKGRLDSDTYASFERLTKLIITVEGSDPKRLVTIGEELAAIGGDRLFAHCVVSEARMRLSSVASRLSEIGREAYVKGQGVTAADHDWLTEQKEWLGQNDNSEKRSVFGIAASFVLGRLLAAVSD